jgi:hypothetical protein
VNIIEFLGARISEGEAVAQTGSLSMGWFRKDGTRSPALFAATNKPSLTRMSAPPGYVVYKAEDRLYIAESNPGRILAECAAKRQLLIYVLLVVTDVASEVVGTSEYVLMCMGSPYRDHPD